MNDSGATWANCGPKLEELAAGNFDVSLVAFESGGWSVGWAPKDDDWRDERGETLPEAIERAWTAWKKESA